MKNKKKWLRLLVLVLAIGGTALFASPARGGDGIQLSIKGDEAVEFSSAVKLMLLITALTFAPAVLLTMTSFVRLIVVFSFLRQAMGLQQTPPTQVLVGLSVILTFFIMKPTWDQLSERAVVPYRNGNMTEREAMAAASVPLKEFMARNTREKDLMLFMEVAHTPAVNDVQEVPMTVLVPAFMISELKTAFQIGFMIYIPFLVIDIVVASVLLSMGMLVLPPVVISLPFKLMIFVLVDGWNLIVASMIQSFG